jgi:hypothetical protein
MCWPFEGGAFGAGLSGPEWGNANGWANVQYYSTLQAAGGCVARAETCNQKDDDCDGEIDEGDACSSAGGAGGSGAGGGSGGGWGGNGAAGSAGAAAKPDGSSDEGGCGCRQAPSRAGSVWEALCAAALLAGLRRRRIL